MIKSGINIIEGNKNREKSYDEFSRNKNIFNNNYHTQNYNMINKFCNPS